MPLRIGETFAGYRVLRLLGSGGMGEVYLVQHPRLPRRDALKVLRHDISIDAFSRAVRARSRPGGGCAIPISSEYTTEANTTGSCGSRWTTWTEPTQAN